MRSQLPCGVASAQARSRPAHRTSHLAATPAPPGAPRAVIVESTYGVSRHLAREVREKRFLEKVRRAVTAHCAPLRPLTSLRCRVGLLAVCTHRCAAPPLCTCSRPHTRPPLAARAVCPPHLCRLPSSPPRQVTTTLLRGGRVLLPIVALGRAQVRGSRLRVARKVPSLLHSVRSCSPRPNKQWASAPRAPQHLTSPLLCPIHTHTRSCS